MMGALAYDVREAAAGRQPRLFAVTDAAAPVGRAPVAEPAPEGVAGATVVSLPVVARPSARTLPAVAGPVPAGASRPVRTLDDLVDGLFREIGAGRQSTCGFCGGAVRPRPVAAGAVGGGRCDGCGTAYAG